MNDIVVFGHPSLTSKSVNVDNIDDYIINLSKKMIDIMYAAPGVGLAAPQIGINKNIFVFDAGDGPKVAINPKLEDLQGSVVFMEGCLSQHELDHLKGKLLLKSMTRKQRKEALKEISIKGFPGDKI